MYYVEGKGIRTIARALNISKNTVKKVIRSDKTKFELTQHSRKKPALENYLGILHQLLEKNSSIPSNPTAFCKAESEAYCHSWFPASKLISSDSILI